MGRSLEKTPLRDDHPAGRCAQHMQRSSSPDTPFRSYRQKKYFFFLIKKAAKANRGDAGVRNPKHRRPHGDSALLCLPEWKQ